MADVAAVRVEITLDGHAPLMVGIGANGFFIGDLPDEVAEALLVEPTSAAPIGPVGPVRAFDAAGQLLATSP